MNGLMTQSRKDNTIENLMAHYFDERAINLTPVEKDQKKRCEAAFTMLIEDDSITKTVKKLMSLFKISQTTAYRTINMAEQLFGSVKKFNKDAWRFIQIERKRRLIKTLKKEKQWDLVVKLEGQIDVLLDFDKGDLLFDPDKIKSQDYDITVSKSMQDALVKAILKGPIDMNELEVEDIVHEEVD